MDKKFWDKEKETMPLKELKALQLKRLKGIVGYAYKNNQFYKKRMKDAGVEPDTIRTLNDVNKLPFLTKDDLRQYYPFGLVCVPMNEVVEIHASSGTTGKPVVGTYTKNDLALWAELMARALYANGLRKNDVMQNAYGYGLFTGAHGFHYGAQLIGANVVPTGSGNTKRQIQLMKDFGTTVLACTPSYSMYIAEEARNMGFNPLKDFKLRLGLFGAEAWSDELRGKIEETWGIKAMEHYGLTELIGPGVSVDCGARAGLHVNADHFLMEVIDPNTGEQIGEDEKGELVFTTLTKEAFPAIRFRTKDLATFTEEKCECGRTFPRHSRIMGRSDDMMKVKGVIVFPRQIEEAIMSVEGTSENYLIVKRKSTLGYELLVRVEPTAAQFKAGKIDELKKKIEDEIFAILNLNVPVSVVEPGALPRSEGKAKRVVEEQFTSIVS
ncbi:MAG: phenylacetate--CoA ligase [Thermoplasmata archaeon HGW-Thermoplasmata-2]|nr:MAG: phenylacetate--CoA ligase [Thermoplasmata archaeon HGW-Thermoplasmata-2]